MFKQQQQEEWDYNYYLNSPDKIRLPGQASEYFKILDDIARRKKKPTQNDIVPIKLLNAFSLLSKEQQARYITENLRYLYSIEKHNKSHGTVPDNPHVLCKDPKTIIAHIEKKKKLLCFSVPLASLKLQTASRTLLLNEQKNISMIDLQNYLVHKGTKVFKNTIELEPIIHGTSSWQQIKRYQFVLPDRQFTRMYNELFNCVMDIRNQELVSLFTQPVGLIKSEILKNNLELPDKLINKKQYQDFIKYKKHILSDLGIQYYKFKTKIYDEVNKDTMLVITQSDEKSQKNLFKAQFLSQKESYQIKLQLLDSIQLQKNTLIIDSQVLQTYQPTCVALFEKYFLGSNPHQTIYMRQILSVTNLLMSNSIKSIISIEDKKRYEDFMFIKAIQNPIVNSFVNFLCFFINSSPKNKDYINGITIIGQFNINPKFTIQMVKQFFCQIYYSTFDIARHKELDLVKKQSLKTSNVSFKPKIAAETSSTDKEKNSNSLEDQNPKQVRIQFAEPDTAPLMVRKKFRSEEEIGVDKLTATYLRHRFEMKPAEGYDLKKSIVKSNFMGSQWKRGKDGALICLNQKLLNQHKKLFKHLLASLGSNILKGGNILNVSLPVTIFAKKGHLQIIADSFSIAPRLLQNVTSPLERLKYALIISVAVGTLGISVQKPFFPTIGQTLQVWIAGCPMYMQQILRYPPTTQYLFFGRGFKLYGQVEPKISFAINGGKGYSESPSYLQFDDGQKISLSYAKLAVNGLFFGDREFNFQDKAFAYDMKNGYFGELIFGPKDKNFFGKNGQNKDYIYGRIYQVSPDFALKFDKQPPPKPFPSKKHIINTISQFEGHWNGAILFDGKQYINFLTDLPNAVEKQQFALPSDTTFRKDLLNLINGNIQQAQKQKQAHQELQRRDRKLRAQKTKR